jgi:proteasome lid subunit RPN8/RPN11
VPTADLLADLWLWPGHSDFLELYVARPLLAAISAQAVFKPTEIGGYLLGRHYILREADGRDRHVVLIINSYKVEGASGGEEFSFGHGNRARDLKGMAEVPELQDLEIVGWYHSHHNRGAFLSPSVDQPLHRRYFPEPHQVAYVLDMQRRQAGFFIWEGPELLSGPGQCLALFDPSTLEIKATRRGKRRNEDRLLKNFQATWKSPSLRDGLVAVTSLLIGLSAFIYAFSNRPFHAWTILGTQELRWEDIREKVLSYTIYRSESAEVRTDLLAPIARRGHSDRSLDLLDRDRRVIAPADVGKRFYYRVAAVDESGKPFRWSRPVPIVVPVNRPPNRPEAKFEVSDARDRTAIALKPTTAEDIMGYWLLREGPLLTKNHAILNGGKPIPSRSGFKVEDAPTEKGAYRYFLIPQDWSGNLGDPWDSAAVALSGRPRRFFGLF